MSKSKASTGRKPRVVAVASFGGHLVQLMRIMQQFSDRYDLAYITTNPKAKPAGCTDIFYSIPDFSRSNPWVILKSMWACMKILRKEKPDALVSTGAAPGLSAILVARLMGIPTLWIDSIANVEKLSMCGRIASHIATSTLTQWPELQTDKVKYSGAVI